MKEKRGLEYYDYSFYKERKRLKELEEEGDRYRREKQTYRLAVAGFVIAALSLLWQILEKVL
jgi:hypothetical protein